MKGKNKLNLGCGDDYREDMINIDIDKSKKADIHCNLEKGIPVKDNSIEYIFTRHCLEHLHQEYFTFMINEMKRVCKNGAIIEIYLPYFTSFLYFRTMTHYTPMTLTTFDGLGFEVINKKMYFFRVSYPYKENKVANTLRIFNPILSFLPNTFPRIYERLFCWTYPMEELYFKLKVNK